jgi:hypothetical protein
MNSGLELRWADGYIQVDFNFRKTSRARLLLGLEITALAGLALAFAVRSYYLQSQVLYIITAGVVLLAAGIVCRALHRFSYHERLYVDPIQFSIVQKSWFSHSVRRFERDNMGPLHYLGVSATDFLNSESRSDTLGLAHSDRLFRAVAANGNLCFDYQGERIYFGRGVYSWHAEELVTFLQLYCGESLRLGPGWNWITQEEDVSNEQ